MKRAQPYVSIVYDLAPSFNVSLWSFFSPFFFQSKSKFYVLIREFKSHFRFLFLLDLTCRSCLYHKAFRTSTAQPHFSKIVQFALQPLDGSVPIGQHCLLCSLSWSEHDCPFLSEVCVLMSGRQGPRDAGVSFINFSQVWRGTTEDTYLCDSSCWGGICIV